MLLIALMMLKYRNRQKGVEQVVRRRQGVFWLLGLMCLVGVFESVNWTLGGGSGDRAMDIYGGGSWEKGVLRDSKRFSSDGLDILPEEFREKAKKSIDLDSMSAQIKSKLSGIGVKVEDESVTEQKSDLKELRSLPGPGSVSSENEEVAPLDPQFAASISSDIRSKLAALGLGS
ncbi:hypothetical protein NDN08_007109 [Rhodosorus marinus]|uniref:Uncharacterized protein n=1 Tax=Rhodosorus marinus TaxID=101924 RepID=A0AAV8UFK4_9RHOD|nr:hypothetical protein NDN08_007109 [Rhodosorus marinus]